MKSQLQELDSLFRSTKKSNPILCNVILLIIDSVPEYKMEIVELIKKLRVEANSEFLMEILDKLYIHNEEWKILLEDSTEQKLPEQRKEPVFSDETQYKENNNNLLIPPELVFFGNKKRDRKFDEFLDRIGAEMERLLRNRKEVIFRRQKNNEMNDTRRKDTFQERRAVEHRKEETGHSRKYHSNKDHGKGDYHRDNNRTDYNSRDAKGHNSNSYGRDNHKYFHGEQFHDRTEAYKNNNSHHRDQDLTSSDQDSHRRDHDKELNLNSRDVYREQDLNQNKRDNEKKDEQNKVYQNDDTVNSVQKIIGEKVQNEGSARTGKKKEEHSSSKAKEKKHGKDKKRFKAISLMDKLFPELQCRMCGLRFHGNYGEQIDQSYIDHVEQHQKKIQNMDENVYRPFFVDVEGWLNEKPQKIHFNFDEPERKNVGVTSETFKNPAVSKILVKKKLVHCALCKNKMNVIWDDDDDSWAIKDGVKLGDEFVHKDCAF